MKKFKAIIGVIWFVISLILMFLCCYRYQDFIAISLINVGISFDLAMKERSKLITLKRVLIMLQSLEEGGNNDC